MPSTWRLSYQVDDNSLWKSNHKFTKVYLLKSDAPDNGQTIDNTQL